MNLPRALNHIGLSVPDIHAAFAWYRDVLGCIPVVPPAAPADNPRSREIGHDLFGERMQGLMMAHMVTANGVGIEMFQFVEPRTRVPQNTFEYERAGIFHFSITAPDIRELAEKIEKTGGRILSRVWPFFKNKDTAVVYCQDPWGTVIELSTRSYEQTWSGMIPNQPFD